MNRKENNSISRKFPFSQIPSVIITDMNISHGAFRLYSYLCSKPENWNFWNGVIMAELGIKDNQTLANYWKELIDTGWVARHRKSEDGKFIGGYDYIINEIQKPENPILGKIPNWGKSLIRENPILGKIPNHNNKDFLSNKDFSNNTTSCEVEEEEVLRTKNEIPLKSNKQITPNDFELFWNLYPKKTDKGKTLSAWAKLCNKKELPTFKEIKLAVLRQKETDRWQQGYIPMPTTWINQSRWMDDPAEMKSFQKTKARNILSSSQQVDFDITEIDNTEQVNRRKI